MIRPALESDALAIADIYNYYIENTIITFEEVVIDESEMKARIRTLMEKFPWLVYEQNGNVLGYAYACPWRTRSAYRYAVEASIYLSHNGHGKGIGTALYRQLIGVLKQQNFHVVIGGIALPNAASIALHEKLGFEKIAHFHQSGFKFEQWIDVGYWQLLLENDELSNDSD